MNELRGTRTLLALALRRDKVLLPVYAVTFAGVATASAAATAEVYPDLASRVQGADLVNATPGLVALYGRIYDPTSAGELAVFKLVALGTALVGLFAALVVVRHTRADEELGRTELLAAGSVGRAAGLAAAVLAAAAGCVAVGVGTAGGLAATGLPPAGAVAFGLAWTAAGLGFAGLGAVAAQLTASARAARALVVGVAAAAFLLRAVGDTTGTAQPGWATWLSPIGWAQQIRPFAGDRWALASLPVALGVLATGLAVLLSRRRDFGAGLLPQRSGPARGSALLSSPLGLAWRLQRSAFLGWLGAFVLLSVLVGQILTRTGDLLSSPAARQLVVTLGGTDQLAAAFLAVELSFISVFASAYGISAVLRLAAEETSLRADLALTTPVGRTRWAGSHVTVAVLGTGLLMTACGLAVGLVHVTQTGTWALLADDLAAAAARLPAIWTLVGAAVALYGGTRRAAPFAWTVLVVTFLASEMGAALGLPRWVRDLSPFTHVPDLPVGQPTAAPVLALTVIAAGLMTLGLITLRRRDLSAA